MADFYFPTLAKLIGEGASKGLTDKIFASQEPDKLRSVLQALEDSYGPHDIPAGLVDQIIDLYTAEVKDGLFAAIDATYGAGPEGGVPTKQALKDLIFKEAAGADRASGILTSDSGLIPGKLEEISKAITKAYGNKPVPPTMLDSIAAAWDTFTPADGLKGESKRPSRLPIKPKRKSSAAAPTPASSPSSITAAPTSSASTTAILKALPSTPCPATTMWYSTTCSRRRLSTWASA